MFLRVNVNVWFKWEFFYRLKSICMYFVYMQERVHLKNRRRKKIIMSAIQVVLMRAFDFGKIAIFLTTEMMLFFNFIFDKQ